ncbi:MAG TPA: hypothetical protein VK841_12870 [Polyangiaceae bacterium]|nr:hypothetical protein [Polyangiaceae bacterium]
MRISSTESRHALSAEPAPPTGASSSATPVVLPSPFARLMHVIGNELNRGERIMATAVGSMQRGGDYSPAQLIALQAGVYRYSEAIDLASRVVDRATSGVKTILQGNTQ